MTGEKNSFGWSENDLQSISSTGIPPGEIERQLAVFRTGAFPVRLLRPCTPGDGITVIAEKEKHALLTACEEARQDGRLMKFVPASGAASRMFREWHVALMNGKFTDATREDYFGETLRQYAFYADLEKTTASKGKLLEQMLDGKDYRGILALILTDQGLNYGSLPKALLKFHSYPDSLRTAIEEHLVEAAMYVRDDNRIARIHFTVSGEHERLVREKLLQVMSIYELRFDTVFDFDISVQDPATHTIAVDLENRPFHDENGKLVFRPSGHGALLSNLESLDTDIVFVKNIDNVVADSHKGDTVLWKKLLAGYLLTVQQEIFDYLLILENPTPSVEKIPEIVNFCENRLNIGFPEIFNGFADCEKRHFLFDTLNRPLRVCGMVKNEGEPGGGPFRVENRLKVGESSLQIVEESQIDRNDPQQMAIWSSSTHFNPVDLVCGLNDYRGRKFNLAEFVDNETSIITRKSEKGKDLLALERPGLWNGSMAFWNTIFVEVPPTTFAPVKSVNDLLRGAHQNRQA